MVYRTVSTLLSCTLLAASAAAQPMLPAIPAAYGGAPMVAPGAQAAPGPRAFLGCWQTRYQIYGGFHVAFCTEATGAGLYHVRGQGFDCQGSSSWQLSADGRRFTYQMGPGSCRPQADWTADRMVCVPEAGWSDAHATYRGLDCVYLPAKPGERSIRFSAFHQ